MRCSNTEQAAIEVGRIEVCALNEVFRKNK